MSSVQLQWTSSLREDYCPSAKAKLCTKVRNFSRKFNMRTKRRTVSPEMVLTNPTSDSLAGPALMQKGKNTTVCTEHEKPPSEDCTQTNANPKLSNDVSDTTSRKEAKPQFLDGFMSSTADNTTSLRGKSDGNQDDRKWTRNVIFEADKLVLESEIDQLNTPPSGRRSEPHSLNTAKTNKKSMLLSESVNETNLREKSMSSPSLLEVDNYYRKGGGPVQRGVLSSQSQRDVTRNPSSSLVKTARRIGKSTSKSFHSLNNLSFFSTNEKQIYKSREIMDEEGSTALLRAAKNDCLIQAQSLIGHGISTEVLDQRGWTPLFIALECENMECAELLVKLNANVNFVNVNENGMTILHKITSIGLYNGVKFLLRYGADTNAKDCRGWPAVHYAIRGAHLKCAAMLLAAGCDSESYTKKRVEEYGETIKMATVGKWKYHWQHKLDIDMEHEIHL